MILGQALPVLESKHASKDVAPDTDPASEFWRGAHAMSATRDQYGNTVADHQTEIRSRWTDQNLYFLFVCHYRDLNMKPNPRTDIETNHLWNWDVAEVFIGSDFQNIRRYKEFEVSPQGEWVDLDIDLNKPEHEDGWTWNSGFQVAARIDDSAKVWYGCMRIPYASIDTRSALPGNVLRVNFYRAQGPPSRHVGIAWQPTNRATYHVPESFGTLKLVP